MSQSVRPDRPGPQSFSDGVDRLLAAVRPHGRPETAFPDKLIVTDTRRTSGETLHAWFVRLVDQYCASDPNLVALEENVAVFAKFKWEKDRLIYASVPTLVAGCTLVDFYLDPNAGATYFRLDVDYATLGEPFSHPLAHVHVGVADSPRFALDGGSSGNVVVDFLEFVYRNEVPAKWLRWARREWLSERDDELRASQFDRIVRAFHERQFGVLRQDVHVLTRIKRMLRASKDDLFKSHLNGADRELLEYPLAR
jgi:hypothetical protein